MYQLVEKYETNPRLTNLQILEIRKIVPKVTKCADSWRISLKKKLRNCCEFQKFAKWPQTSLNVPIR